MSDKDAKTIKDLIFYQYANIIANRGENNEKYRVLGIQKLVLAQGLPSVAKQRRQDDNAFSAWNFPQVRGVWLLSVGFKHLKVRILHLFRISCFEFRIYKSLKSA
jgi:retron-type reverse transcriptase